MYSCIAICSLLKDIFYMKIKTIVMIIPTNLITNSFFPFLSIRRKQNEELNF